MGLGASWEAVSSGPCDCGSLALLSHLSELIYPVLDGNIPLCSYTDPQ